MLGMGALLRDTLLTAEQGTFVQTIETCGDALLTLIGDVLDMSSLERNNIVLHCAPFDLRLCLEEVLDIAAPLVGNKPLELLCSMLAVGQPELWIVGDAARVRQVLLNLVTNAIKVLHLPSLPSSCRRHHLHVTIGCARGSSRSAAIFWWNARWMRRHSCK